jgi:glycosyltransferase involved in cell wall biosynthesis
MTGVKSRKVAIIWQRFLPYHTARLRHLRKRLIERGDVLTAIEVASSDESYAFPDASEGKDFDYTCCFPGTSYHGLAANEVLDSVLATLRKIQPDIVFAPATPFPEGMAAIRYRLESGCRTVLMDDAWEHTDRRGWVTRFIKRQIHANVDAAFIPAPSHSRYFEDMGFPADRIVLGVDVVDNDYFSASALKARAEKESLVRSLKLAENYFLFVGRFLPRKGIEDLLRSYGDYRNKVADPWDMVLVGTGPAFDQIRSASAQMSGVYIAGPQFGDDLCLYYALAGALVVPSVSDPWGLVINEGMASGLPVIVSRGCGAAKTLVLEGENGWTFDPGDSEGLAGLLMRMSSFPTEERDRMAERSREIIAAWSLDRFAEGVLEAMSIPRRRAAGLISNLAVRLWKGRMRTT